MKVLRSLVPLYALVSLLFLSVIHDAGAKKVLGQSQLITLPKEKNRLVSVNAILAP